MCIGSCYICFFFFKQKTAYEMRISDWSSDVCSSDLKIVRQLVVLEVVHHGTILQHRCIKDVIPHIAAGCRKSVPERRQAHSHVLPAVPQTLYQPKQPAVRSEERRVGKECVSTCRSRWWPYHKKKTKKNIIQQS